MSANPHLPVTFLPGALIVYKSFIHIEDHAITQNSMYLAFVTGPDTGLQSPTQFPDWQQYRLLVLRPHIGITPFGMSPLEVTLRFNCHCDSTVRCWGCKGLCSFECINAIIVGMPSTLWKWLCYKSAPPPPLNINATTQKKTLPSCTRQLPQL